MYLSQMTHCIVQGMKSHLMVKERTRPIEIYHDENRVMGKTLSLYRIANRNEAHDLFYVAGLTVTRIKRRILWQRSEQITVETPRVL